MLFDTIRLSGRERRVPLLGVKDGSIKGYLYIIFSRCDYSAVCKAADDLADQACVLSARYLKDGTLRLQFNREVFCYGRGIVNEVAQGKKSPEQGLKDINNEQNHLQSRSLEVAQKGVAAIAGVLQFAAGAGMCYGSAGLLCLFGGAPLMAHGANNAYENGRSLWGGRSDTTGPPQKGLSRGRKNNGWRRSCRRYGLWSRRLGTFRLWCWQAGIKAGCMALV